MNSLTELKVFMAHKLLNKVEDEEQIEFLKNYLWKLDRELREESEQYP